MSKGLSCVALLKYMSWYCRWKQDVEVPCAPIRSSAGPAAELAVLPCQPIITQQTGCSTLARPARGRGAMPGAMSFQALEGAAKANSPAKRIIPGFQTSKPAHLTVLSRILSEGSAMTGAAVMLSSHRASPSMPARRLNYLLLETHSSSSASKHM